MASVGAYGNYTGYKKPALHTNPTLYRRTGVGREDIGKYGYQQRPGDMVTVNTVNMMHNKENQMPSTMQSKDLTYRLDYPTQLQGHNKVGSVSNRGHLQQRTPPQYNSPPQKPRVSTQSQSRMTNQKALVPVREFKSDLAPRIHVAEPQVKSQTNDAQVSDGKEGLSTGTKVGVLARNRQLIYVETVWTKKRLEKLRESGFGDYALVKKLRSIKEKKRWDTIMRTVQQEPNMVHTLWQFLKTDFPNLFNVLYKEYQTIIRKHFKPRISNLQTTPANANKMLDILMEQSEEFDQRMYDVGKALQEQEDMLEDIRKVIDETRRVVFDWGGRELPEVGEEEEEEDLKDISQQVLDTIVVVSQEKNQLLEKQKAANEELRKKLAKLSKAAKNDKQQK